MLTFWEHGLLVLIENILQGEFSIDTKLLRAAHTSSFKKIEQNMALVQFT